MANEAASDEAAAADEAAAVTEAAVATEAAANEEAAAAEEPPAAASSARRTGLQRHTYQKHEMEIFQSTMAEKNLSAGATMQHLKASLPAVFSQRPEQNLRGIPKETGKSKGCS